MSYFVINTNERQSNNNNDFQYNLNNNITINKYLKLVYASIVHSEYLINENTNVFNIKFADNTTYNLTLNIQDHTNITSFLTYLISLIPYASFNAVYQTNLYKVLFSATQNFTITWGDDILYMVFGFKNNIPQISISNNLYSGIVNLQITNNLYVNINNINDNIITNINSYGYYIPITGNTKSIINYYNQLEDENKITLKKPIKLNILNIKIFTNNNKLYYNNNAPIILIFKYE